MDSLGGGADLEQSVSVTAGVGYGVIGADLHIYADGVPLYLLTEHAPAAQADSAWLRELPSRMLNARFQVVGFTGRREEITSLHAWRREEVPLSVRWLHGAGGRGKTRLASQFADEAALVGWKVVHAVHGPGTVLPLDRQQQDLRLDDADGVLLMVDYADRWPLTDLRWLLRNRILQQGVPTRILLLARGTHSWPLVQAMVGDEAAASEQELRPLDAAGRQRADMFAAARRSFAAAYGVDDDAVIEPPGPLDDPEMGLTLALHMAALVAVDAYAASREPPRGMEALTIYLLDREQLQWVSRYGERGRNADRLYRTPPEIMNQVVFTAAMTGALPTASAVTVLSRLRLGDDADQLLRDHAACYPAAPANGGAALEPLYPDRLAEDFLGLSLPGHAADYPAADWAGASATTLLTGGRDLLMWLPRSVTFLAAAAHRWPHLGERHLYPVLRSQPHLLLAAGSAAITSLTSIDSLDMRVLEAVEPLLPSERNLRLDVGAAAITERLTSARLPRERDPVERARMLAHLGWRYTGAGRAADAFDATQRAVAILRGLPPSEQRKHRDALASVLTNLGSTLMKLGRWEAGLAVTTEAVNEQRVLVRENPSQQRTADLAMSVHNVGVSLRELRRLDEALVPAQETVRLYRSLAADFPEDYLPELAAALGSLGTLMSMLDRDNEATAATREALAIRRRLTAEAPDTHQQDQAVTRANLGAQLSEMRQWDEALAETDRAFALQAQVNSITGARHDPTLAALSTNRAAQLWELGRHEEAVTEARVAVESYRLLAQDLPGKYQQMLATALANLGRMLSELGKAEMLEVIGESVAIRRGLADADPTAYVTDLAFSLATLTAAIAQQGHLDQALDLAREAVDRHRAAGLAQIAGAPPLIRDLAVESRLGRRSPGGRRGGASRAAGGCGRVPAARRGRPSPSSAAGEPPAGPQRRAGRHRAPV